MNQEQQNNAGELLPRQSPQKGWPFPVRELPEFVAETIATIQTAIHARCGKMPQKWQVVLFVFKVAAPILDDAIETFIQEWEAQHPPRKKRNQ